MPSFKVSKNLKTNLDFKLQNKSRQRDEFRKEHTGSM